MENKGQNDRNGVFAIKKEITAKKKRFFGALLSSAIKGSLFASALVFNCVLGDVTTDPAAAPGGGGPAIVANNLFPGGPGGPAIGAVPAPGSFAAYVAASIAAPPAAAGIFIGNNWQMRGYAAFVNGAGVVQKVYIASKRSYAPGNPPVNPVANNNPGAGGNLLHYSHNMHTERQLAIAALSEALLANPLGVVPGPPVAPPAANVLHAVAVPGALTLPFTNIQRLAVTAGAAGLVGTLHIYTDQPPCRNPQEDNNDFSCISYYNALGAMFPNVTFHIYFQAANMTLNEWYITNTPGARVALFDNVDALMAAGTIAGHLRIRSMLQNFHTGNWHSVTDLDAAPAVVPGAPGNWNILPLGGNTLVATINRILRNFPGVGNLTIQERFNMFLAVHVTPATPPNVQYHLI
jgi:hypothetical protein